MLQVLPGCGNDGATETAANVSGYWQLVYTLPGDDEPESETHHIVGTGDELTATLCSTVDEMMGGEWVVTDVECDPSASIGTIEGTSFSYTLGAGTDAATVDGTLIDPDHVQGEMYWAGCDCSFSFTAERIEVPR